MGAGKTGGQGAGVAGRSSEDCRREADGPLDLVICLHSKTAEHPESNKEAEEDRLYKDDQMSGPRIMYCQTFADQHWLIMMERRKHEEERLAVNR